MTWERKVTGFQHPFEVTVRGGAAGARRGVAEGLAAELRPTFRAAVLVGSQSDRQAIHTTINSSEAGTEYLKPGEPDLFDSRYALLDSDLVLAVDPGPDEGGEILLTFDGEAIARVGGDPMPRLAALAGDRLETAARRAPLYGLVLAGGKSTRMGRPKWAIEYHGEPQALVLQRLLSSRCEQAFVSVRDDQQDEPALSALLLVADRFLGMGPLGGILSAMSAHPQAAWLVVACDLPFVSDATLQALLAGRRPLRFATSFVSPHDGMPEPLCAIYEPKARLRLFQSAALGYDCPRKMLMNSPVELLECDDPRELSNANEPRDFEQALARLAAGEAR